MELGESNLHLMIGYMLVRYNPQRGNNWGISLDWFTNKKHQGFRGSKIWVTLVRHGKSCQGVVPNSTTYTDGGT